MDIEQATASASELARINPDGDTPIGDKPREVTMPRTFSLDDDDKSQAIQRITSVILLLFLVYAVVMSTYAVIAVGNANRAAETCVCSTEDIESALIIIGKGPPTTAAPSLTPSIQPSRSPSSSPSMQPSTVPSVAPSNEPTVEPTLIPTNEPTVEPTLSPTIEPTTNPTLEPTLEPTMNPTPSPTFFDGNFIGDYKVSLQSSDHGFWKLCDGESLEIDGAYATLFDVIGFAFGGSTVVVSNTTNITYFQLPNITDSVMGIAGSMYSIGAVVGSETMTLSDNEMANHFHFLTSSGGCNNADTYFSTYTIGFECRSPEWLTADNNMYTLRASTSYANTYASSWEGSGNAFSLMQPTTFIGNLFVYTGVYV